MSQGRWNHPSLPHRGMWDGLCSARTLIRLSPGSCSAGMKSSRAWPCRLCFLLGWNLFSLGLNAGSWSAVAAPAGSGIGNAARERPELAGPRAGVCSASWPPAAAPVPTLPAFPPHSRLGSAWHRLLPFSWSFPALCPCVDRRGWAWMCPQAQSSSSMEISSRGSWKTQPLAATFKTQPSFGLNLLLFN